MKSKINKLFAWLVVFLLVIGLAGFGLQDVVSRWGTSRVATVGDTTISTEDFRLNFVQELNYLAKILNQPITATEAKSMGIHLRVLEKLINKALLDQMLKDMQISTGDTFLVKNLKSDPNFRNPSGEFSRQNYQLYLDRLNLSENQFEEILRKDMTRSLAVKVLDGEFSPNSNISKLLVDHLGEKRLISIHKANDNLDNVKKNLNQDDLTNFFELNKENYRTSEIKKVSFIKLDPIQLAEEIEISEEDLLETFNSKKNDYQKPERKMLNRIVFSDKALAKSAVEQIAKGTQTFIKIAETKNLGPEELKYGTFARKELEANLGALIFSEGAGIGSIFGPIEGDLGYEVYEIANIFPLEKLSFEKVRNDLEKELSQTEAKNIILSIAPEIEDMIAAGENLERIAKEFSLQIDSLDWTTTSSLPKPLDNPEFKKLINGVTPETSDLLRLGSDVLITMRLDEKIAPQIPEIEDIWDQVSNDLYRSDRLTSLEESVASILSESNGLDPLDTENFDQLFEETLDRQSRINFLDSDALDEIFQAKPGDLIVKPATKSSIPYLIIIRVEKIIAAAQNSEQYEEMQSSIQQQMNEQIRNDIILSVINKLREIYAPTINVKLVDRIISNLQ